MPLALLALLLAVPGAAADLVEQDGIRAQMDVAGGDIGLHWRFVRPLADPLRDIETDVNGRPLPAPKIEPYPGATGRTAIALVLDTRETRDDIALAQDRRLLVRMVASLRAHHLLVVKTTARPAQIVTPEASSVDEMLGAVLDPVPVPDAFDPGAELKDALAALGGIAATRRALFVLSPERAANAADADGIAATARDHGIAINVLAATEENSAGDAGAWAALARSTRGELVPPSALARFLAEPYALTDSGADAVISLAGAFRLPWESATEAHARLRYGGKELVLAMPLTLPGVSLSQLTRHVLALPQLPVGAAVVGIVAAAIGFGLHRRARSRRAAKADDAIAAAANAAAGPSPAAAPRATLQDIASGAVHPITTPLIRIGRNAGNDIVLADPTVGRFHAVLFQAADGTFSIVDQASANGTLVNDQRVETAALDDGDRITIGQTRLRFHCATTARGLATPS